MRPNHLRTMLQSGDVPIGTMIQEFRSPAIAHFLVNAGFDFIFIDMEHGVFNLETAADLIRTSRLAGLTSLVRVPENEYHWISRMLDSGAEGIMIPRIETRADAEHAVESMRYPPIGKRGLSINKGHNEYRKQDLQEFIQQANRENLLILQIERKAAVENIDDILSVPGVDIALVGPNDLAVSYSLPLDWKNDDFRAAIQTVAEACKRHNITFAMHTDLNPLVEWRQRGLEMMVYSSDIEFINKAMTDGLAVLKQKTNLS